MGEPERIRTKEAIVLSRTMRPTALAAEKMKMSNESEGLRAMRRRLGRREPVKLEARAAATAIIPAKTLVQTYVGDVK